MFPEIVRDDIFRLETRRLWLCWPTAAYADVNLAGPLLPHLDAKRNASVGRWRSDMEQGSALHLMLVDKTTERRAIGTIHLVDAGTGRLDLRCDLDEAHRGAGLMTEAVQAATDVAFLLLGPLVEICASPHVLDLGGRRVLERCGFTYVGTGMRDSRDGKGLAACDHFRLDRKTWISLKGWRIPGLGTAATMEGRPPATTLPMVLTG